MATVVKKEDGWGTAGMEKVSGREFALLFGMGAAIILNLVWNSLKPVSDLEILREPYQAMYNDTFYENGLYPDMFLRRAVDGRNVAVAREVKDYGQYRTFGHDGDDGNPFDRMYLVENDYTLWFRQNAAGCRVDESLMDGEREQEKGLKKAREEEREKDGKEAEVNGSASVLSELEKLRGRSSNTSDGPDNFVDLGIANDMLRYSFELNRDSVQQATAFWYAWYYHTWSEKRERERGDDFYPNIYVNADSLLEDEDEELVALWGRNQDLYLMGRGYYERLVSGRRENARE